MKMFLRNYGLVLLLAFIVGALTVAPHLLAARSLGSDYKGIPFMYLDNEDQYLARIQEIIDGYPTVGSAFLYEYKNEKPIQLPLGEYVYVATSRLTGFSLPQTLVATKFVLPMILFLLVFAMLARLLSTESPRIRTMGAITAGLLVVLGYDMLSVRELLQVLQGQDIGVRLSIWTRPVNPILGGIGVFGCLLLLWNIFEHRRKWTVPLAGILLGSLVFYFFAWGFVLSVIAVSGVLMVLQKNWRHVRDLAFVILISFVVSAPYWYLVFTSMGGAKGRVLAMRNGMFFTHDPLINKTLLAALAVFGVGSYLIARRNRNWKQLIREPWWVMSISLLLGGLWALNQQIITGRMIWPYHFVQYTEPAAMIVSVVILIRVVSFYSFRLAKTGAIFFSILIIFQAVVAASTYRSVLSDFRERQKDAELFVWINENAPKDCVILVEEAQERLDRLVPAFTHCNVYRSSWVFAGVPDERIEHNFFMHMRLQGITGDRSRDWLKENSNELRAVFFRDWHEMFAWKTDDAWLNETADRLASRYADFYKQDFHIVAAKYRLDYVVIDEKSELKIADSLRLFDPTQIGKFKIYRFEP